jgi:hypothetical protein
MFCQRCKLTRRVDAAIEGALHPGRKRSKTVARRRLFSWLASNILAIARLGEVAEWLKAAVC